MLRQDGFSSYRTNQDGVSGKGFRTEAKRTTQDALKDTSRKENVSRTG